MQKTDAYLDLLIRHGRADLKENLARVRQGLTDLEEELDLWKGEKKLKLKIIGRIAKMKRALLAAD